jgi:IQ calmodulin-binding motif
VVARQRCAPVMESVASPPPRYKSVLELRAAMKEFSRAAREYSRRVAAAVKLQALVRGWLARRRSAPELAARLALREQLAEDRRRAAAAIAPYARMFLDRSRFLQLRRVADRGADLHVWLMHVPRAGRRQEEIETTGFRVRYQRRGLPTTVAVWRLPSLPSGQPAPQRSFLSVCLSVCQLQQQDMHAVDTVLCSASDSRRGRVGRWLQALRPGDPGAMAGGVRAPAVCGRHHRPRRPRLCRAAPAAAQERCRRRHPGAVFSLRRGQRVFPRGKGGGAL